MATSTVPTFYKAVVATDYGSFLTLLTLPMPSAGPGSAVVKVLATPCDKGSFGFLDERNPHFCNEVPFIPGVCAVGRVVATGPDATTVRDGQLVLLEPFVHARDDAQHQIVKGLFSGPTPGAQTLARPGLWRDGFWVSMCTLPLRAAWRLTRSGCSETQRRVAWDTP